MIGLSNLRSWVALGIGVTALLGAGPASAQIYMDVSNPNVVSDGRDFVLGYAFSVDNETLLNALGVFDVDSDGLAVSYPIAIWDTANTAVPLVQGTVPGGVGGTLVGSVAGNGSWRMTSVAPTSLLPGNQYVIGMFRQGGSDNWNFGTPTPQPGINYIGARELFTGGLAFPTSDTGTNRHFGPTFGLLGDGGSSAPEPASLALLGLGVVGFLARRRK